MKWRTILLGYGAIAAWSLWPLCLMLLAGTVASLCGAQLDESKPHPCIIFGHDIGEMLCRMLVMGWLILVTLPSGGLGFIAFTILVLFTSCKGGSAGGGQGGNGRPSAPPLPPRKARDEEAPMASEPDWPCRGGGQDAPEPPRPLRAFQSAFDNTRALLFKPFDHVRWLVLGFCSWLAFLGDAFLGDGSWGMGGASIRLPPGGDFQDASNEFLEEMSKFLKADADDGGPERWRAVADTLSSLCREHLGMTLAEFGAALAAAALAAAALAVLLYWVKCRFKFIFLHNVTFDACEVVRPWRLYSREGNSFFILGLCLNAVSALVGIVLAAGMVCLLSATFVPREGGRPSVEDIGPSAILFGGLLLGYVLATSLAMAVFNQFVSAVMMRRRTTAWPAAAAALSLIGRNAGAFAMFFCIYAALNAAVFLSIKMLGCFCCCNLFFSLPYAGAVLLLPVEVFFRLASAEFLAMFGGSHAFQPLRAQDPSLPRGAGPPGAPG